MSQIITLKLNIDDASPRAVSNAIRRAFGSETEPLPEAGERKGVKFTVRQRSTGASSRPLTEAGIIRQWARANDIEVGKRGRIHPDVKAAYEFAH